MKPGTLKSGDKQKSKVINYELLIKIAKRIIYIMIQ